MEQIISIKDQDSKILEIYKEQMNVDGLDKAELHCIRKFAKWFAEEAINKCAEEVKIKIDNYPEVHKSLNGDKINTEDFIYIDTDSILKVKELL